MKKIVVASKNPVKVNAALEGFCKMFPNEHFETEGISVPSGVSDQPMDDAETLQGASNRVINARAQHPDADFCVGIEGGIEEKDGEMEVFAWIVVQSKDGRAGRGRTGTFFLPSQMMTLIKQGKELGDVGEIVFGNVNLKQQGGAIGVLTDGVIDRTIYYTEATVLALIPFKNGTLYFTH